MSTNCDKSLSDKDLGRSTAKLSRYEAEDKPAKGQKSKASGDISQYVSEKLGGGAATSNEAPMADDTDWLVQAMRNHLQPAHEINQRNRSEIAKSQAQAVKERIEGLVGDDRQEAEANLNRILAMPLHSILTPDNEDEGFDNDYLLSRYREQSTLIKSFIQSLYPNN